MREYEKWGIERQGGRERERKRICPQAARLRLASSIN